MTDQDRKGGTGQRGPMNFAAFFMTFLFVWVVFDNLALALIFAAFAAGGSEVAQRAAKKEPD